jgi:nucleotide-binding universal stress UspA family protein
MQRRTAPFTSMSKILVAYDGSDACQEALTTAARLARATNAEVGVISVVPLVPMRGGETVNPWDDHSVHREQLAEAKLLLEARGIQPELIQKTGHPAELIEAVAESGGYDTIVVGRPSMGRGLARLLRGSVGWHVVEHARATVIVTP